LGALLLLSLTPLLTEAAMSVHIQFNNIRNSNAVEEHVNEQFKDLLKITDSKFPFHVNMSKVDEIHEVQIHCSFHHKPLASAAKHENLYKALSKSVDAMRSQVIKRSEKLRQP
jgi:ribosomal subunit interface protein